MIRLVMPFLGRYPGEKAASLFLAKSANSYIDAGSEVIILAARRFGRLKINPNDFYKTSSAIKLVYLPVIDLMNLKLFGFLAYYVLMISFGFSFFVWLLFFSKKNDLIYSNEHFPVFLGAIFGYKTAFEMHDFPEKNKNYYKIFFKLINGLVVTNTWKEKKLKEDWRVKKNILVTPNGVDLNGCDLNRTEARKFLDLSLGQKIIVYTGNLFTWKGVDVLAQAYKYLDFGEIWFVGGSEPYLSNYRQKYKDNSKLHFIGHQTNQVSLIWQKAADVLVLPNSGLDLQSSQYTSPMKLFEYLASGNPVVASDVPAIREIVDESMVKLVQPDNVELLAIAINSILNNQSKSDLMATKAHEYIKNFSWNKRANKVVKYLEIL